MLLNDMNTINELKRIAFETLATLSDIQLLVKENRHFECTIDTYKVCESEFSNLSNDFIDERKDRISENNEKLEKYTDHLENLSLWFDRTLDDAIHP